MIEGDRQSGRSAKTHHRNQHSLQYNMVNFIIIQRSYLSQASQAALMYHSEKSSLHHHHHNQIKKIYLFSNCFQFYFSFFSFGEGGLNNQLFLILFFIFGEKKYLTATFLQPFFKINSNMFTFSPIGQSITQDTLALCYFLGAETENPNIKNNDHLVAD